MNARKQWVVAGTAAVLGVSSAVTAGALSLNDRSSLKDRGAAISLVSDTANQPVAATDTVDTSPESADSPNASAVDSPTPAQQAAARAAAAKAAATKAAAARAAAAQVASANSPSTGTTVRQAASADSPAAAPAPRPAPVSASSPVSPVSPATPASPVSPASPASAASAG